MTIGTDPNPGWRTCLLKTHRILTPTLGEVGKALGIKWKALTDSEKKPYEDRAAEEKKKYEKRKAQYEADNPKAGKSKGAPKKSAKKAKSEDEVRAASRSYVTLVRKT